MFSNRMSPLDAFVRPFSINLHAPFAAASHASGYRKSSGVECLERQTQSVALFQNHVFLWDFDVCKSDHTVVERLESHESTAVQNFNTWCVHFDKERGNLLTFFAPHNLWRCDGHDDDNIGLCAVCAPEFLAVDDVM